MAQPKPIRQTAVSPFADATRTPVNPLTADLSATQSVPSPARMLQASLEASVHADGSLSADDHYSPRLVTASVITVCLAFWMALYLAAAAAF